MFAVLKTGGKQYKVQSGDVLRVEKLAADAGETIQFNDILMLGGDSLTVGAPFVGGAAGEATAERRAVICLLDWAVVLAHHHASAEPRGYSGHYVVLLEFDEEGRAVLLEPGLSAALGACAEGPGVGRCIISEAAFDSARLANGTDEVRS